MTTTRGLERRASDRVILAGKRVRLLWVESGATHARDITLRDISYGGALLIADLQELSPGAAFSIELAVPTWFYSRWLRIPATLLRSEHDRGRYAVRFGLEEGGTLDRRLRRYVERAAGARARLQGDWLSDERLIEALRMAQAGLPAVESDGPRIVVVTSPARSEGKELVTCGLAALLAREGQDVLVADADLANPSIHTAFDVPVRPGLSEWLVSARAGGTESRPSISDLTTRAACGIRVLAAGRAEGQGTKTSLGEFVRALRALDVGMVIVNAPPLLFAAGAGFLAGGSDEVLLVARSGVSQERQLAEAREVLKRHQSNLRGVVLTDHIDVLGGAPPGTAWLDRWSSGGSRRSPEASNEAKEEGRRASEILEGRGALRFSQDES